MLLLVIGVVNVTQTVAAMRQLPLVLAQAFSEAHVGTYTSTDLATGLGWAVIAVQVLALVLAIGFAVPRLTAKKRAFWVPLVAGAAALVVTGGLLVAAIVADPAFSTYVQSKS